MKSWKQLSIRLTTNSILYCFGFFKKGFFGNFIWVPLGVKLGEVSTNLVQGSRVALSNGCHYVARIFLPV